MYGTASVPGRGLTLFRRANPARRAFARRSVSSPPVTVPEAPVRRPALVVVDDEPTVLRAVRRDVQGRFGADYRVIGAPSGAEAEELLGELARRGEAVALVLADQRMPGMTGVELLDRA